MLNGKRFGAILLTIYTVIALTATTVHAGEVSEDTTKVVIHYEPKPADTTDWSVWAWGEGKEGARYPFASSDANGVKTAEIEIPGKHAKVGFIISTADWVKDGGDRFIDIIDGSGEIHIVGGGTDSSTDSGNVPVLWLIVGVLTAIISLTVMEQIRKRRLADA